MAENMGLKTTATVTIPYDRKIFSGQNVLTAVMYSSNSGESLSNTKMDPNSEYVFEFLSGIVKLAAFSTPQAFGADKVCNVQFKDVDDMVEPVVITMPVTHNEMSGLNIPKMQDMGVTCAHNHMW